jgi:NAD(P)-dependent dehydrogenase (short-subunit alcohol dehydrogenase family)
MPTILIVGASRGIGLEYVRQFAATKWRTIGTVRDMAKGADVSKAGGEVHLCDIGDAASVARLAKGLASESIDVLVVNAGIYLGRDWKVGATDFGEFEQILRTNTIAPLRVAEALIEPVARSGRKTIVFTSSRMGSNAQTTGGSMLYRVSKAALNSVAKNLSVDLAPRGITTITTHPGWVRTDMGGASAAIDVSDSVAGLKKVIENLTPADNGKFFNYDGSELPW